MDNGWIKLHRKISKWEWYSNPNVFTLFIHLLLLANHIDKRWQGIEVKRGQFITSYEHLHLDTGLSVHQVRTALNKLKVTGEVTSQSTSTYTIMTIINYGQYQQDDRQCGKRVTSGWQADDKRVATTKKLKNIRMKEENIYIPFLEKYNEVRHSKYKVLDEKTKRQYKLLIENGYKIEDILNATRMAMKDDFHKNSDYKYLTPEFMTRPDKFEKYLNVRVREEDKIV